MNENKNILARHGDKPGANGWEINEAEIRSRLTENETNLIMSVIAQFPEFKGQAPLSLDGIIRAVRLGDSVYDDAPEGRSVLISLNSKVARADFANALATARIGQRESVNLSKDKNKDWRTKIIDMLQIDDAEFVKLMADSDSSTWANYKKMMADEGISENEAVARWLNDLNTGALPADTKIHPEESAERYREVIRRLRSRVTSGNVPMTILGLGHGGSLGQIAYEKKGGAVVENDIPQFCQRFFFDDHGNLIETKRTSI